LTDVCEIYFFNQQTGKERKMRKRKHVVLLTLLTALMVTGCAVNFAGKTPATSTDVRFITGNEDISRNNYEVKGVVVVQRQKMYLDFFGIIKPTNKALSEVFTDDIANELTQKVRELGGNAVMDMEVVNFSALPGGFLYFLPIGSAQVVMQATAVHIK
jgi:hypothetical protein|tara:strand:+ start:24 stop:497 length:474 start_codon:yes stop_codon:yes gene_type:complete